MAKNAKKNETTKKATKKQHKVLQYFRDLKAEFKKVVWPSKKVVINNTTIVLLTMCLSGVFIWALDMGLSQLLDLILKKGS